MNYLKSKIKAYRKQGAKTVGKWRERSGERRREHRKQKRIKNDQDKVHTNIYKFSKTSVYHKHVK